MKRIIPIIILLLVGVIVLGSYFFQNELSPILGLIIDWGILLVGVAGLIGIGYLIYRHIRIISKHEKSALFSGVFLLVFIFTLISGFVVPFQHPFFTDLILNVQIPIETSLLAILAVVLLAASFRLISTRGWTPMSIAFLSSAVINLALDLGSFYFEFSPQTAVFVDFLHRLPLVGARGILLGMALGGLIVGLRVLLTIDKPYGE